MQLLLRHKLLIAGVTVAMAAGGGAAYAATQSGGTGQQAFINDVAKRLNVSPTQLSSAVKAALIDQLNAEVKAGRLTQAQANKIEQQINQNGQLPLFFAPGPGAHRLLGVRVKGGGVLHAAATYLGLSNAQLLNDLRSGKSLAQIAKARGKSVSGLEQAIVTAAKTRLDRAESNGRITKAQEQRLLDALSAHISQLVNQSGIGSPPAGGPAFRLPPGAPMPPNGKLPRNAQMPPFFPGAALGAAPAPGSGGSGAGAPGPGVPGPGAPGPGAPGPNA
jgi:hypothetical protein